MRAPASRSWRAGSLPSVRATTTACGATSPPRVPACGDGRQAKALVAGRPARGPLACRGMRAAVLAHAGDPLVLHDTPTVLGRGAAGIVDAVGADVEGLAPGDPVVLTPVPPCGTCYWCVRGEPGVCVNAGMVTTNTLPDGSTGLARNGAVVFRGVGLGAFAEYVLVPASGAIKVGPDVPLDVACVIGCAVQTGVGAVLDPARGGPGARGA